MNPLLIFLAAFAVFFVSSAQAEDRCQTEEDALVIAAGYEITHRFGNEDARALVEPLTRALILPPNHEEYLGFSDPAVDAKLLFLTSPRREHWYGIYFRDGCVALGGFVPIWVAESVMRNGGLL